MSILVDENILGVNYMEEINESYFYERLKNSLGYMSSWQIEGLVRQIYNHSDNFTGTEICDLIPLFSSYFSILCKKELEHGNEQNSCFKDSLKNSLDVLNNNKTATMRRVEKLQENNRDSFLICPVVAKGHIFSCVIYKRSDSDYELITVNKGRKGRRNVYCGYKLSVNNVAYFLDNFVSREGDSVESVYNFLENEGEVIHDGDSILKEIKISSFNDVRSAHQKAGNCFYKNTEAAVRFAWFVSHPQYRKVGRFIHPKGPYDTEHIHNMIVDNILKCLRESYGDNENLIKSISYERYIYEVNKRFRKNHNQYKYIDDKLCSELDEESLRMCFEKRSDLKEIYEVFIRFYIMNFCLLISMIKIIIVRNK